MWQCSKCSRVFEKDGQVHSCRSVPLERHFAGKDIAQALFGQLLERLNVEVGRCKVVSLPCCIYISGEYDFLAVLPKKDRLEIRFSLDRAIASPRINQAVPLSKTFYKNCLDIEMQDEIDDELIGWLRESYYLKSK